MCFINPPLYVSSSCCFHFEFHLGEIFFLITHLFIFIWMQTYRQKLERHISSSSGLLTKWLQWSELNSGAKNSLQFSLLGAESWVLEQPWHEPVPVLTGGTWVCWATAPTPLNYLSCICWIWSIFICISGKILPSMPSHHFLHSFLPSFCSD